MQVLGVKNSTSLVSATWPQLQYSVVITHIWKYTVRCLSHHGTDLNPLTLKALVVWWNYWSCVRDCDVEESVEVEIEIDSDVNEQSHDTGGGKRSL